MASQGAGSGGADALTHASSSYLEGWIALTQLMHEGASWSGRERNCAYLNCGDGTFADLSAAAGLDFIDDGRSLALTDWDADGCLDAWLKNRTGPQLRFLHNQVDTPFRSVAFRLVGTTCNRDAIGAAVWVDSGSRRLYRTLRAGEGYLAQSSKWMHFGLGDANAVGNVTVQWPGGDVQRFQGIEPGRRYRLVEGQAEAEALAARKIKMGTRPAGESRPTETGDRFRLVLKVPLPLPPDLRAALQPDAVGPQAQDVEPQAQLVHFWAEWCAPCRAELQGLATASNMLAAIGLKIRAVNLDASADQQRANVFLDAMRALPGAAECITPIAVSPAGLDIIDVLLDHITDQPDERPLPLSLLLDTQGSIQVVYLGPVNPAILAADARSYALATRPEHQRSSFEGRWYFRNQRDWNGLADELKRRGHISEARFYLARGVRRVQPDRRSR